MSKVHVRAHAFECVCARERALSPCMLGAATRPFAPGAGPLGVEGGIIVSLWYFSFSWFILEDGDIQTFSQLKCQREFSAICVCAHERASPCLRLEGESDRERERAYGILYPDHSLQRLWPHFLSMFVVS